MLGKKYESWLTDLLFNATLVRVGIYVTNLGYLKDKFSCFTELLESDTDESNKMFVGLDTAAIIPKTDN